MELKVTPPVAVFFAVILHLACDCSGYNQKKTVVISTALNTTYVLLESDGAGISFPNAIEQCATLGGSVTSINSAEENSFLARIITERSSQVAWLGTMSFLYAQNGSVSREISWVNNENPLGSGFAPNLLNFPPITLNLPANPSYPSTTLCLIWKVKLFEISSPTSSNSPSCAQQYPFVCKTPCLNNACPTSWTRRVDNLNRICKCYLMVQVALSWPGALAFCASLKVSESGGGKLLYFDSNDKFEANALANGDYTNCNYDSTFSLITIAFKCSAWQQPIVPNNVSSIWLGALSLTRRIAETATLFWLDGSNPSYALSTPFAANNKVFCPTMKASDGGLQWNKVPLATDTSSSAASLDCSLGKLPLNVCKMNSGATYNALSPFYPSNYTIVSENVLFSDYYNPEPSANCFATVVNVTYNRLSCSSISNQSYALIRQVRSSVLTFANVANTVTVLLHLINVTNLYVDSASNTQSVIVYAKQVTNSTMAISNATRTVMQLSDVSYSSIQATRIGAFSHEIRNGFNHKMNMNGVLSAIVDGSDLVYNSVLMEANCSDACSLGSSLSATVYSVRVEHENLEMNGFNFCRFFKSNGTSIQATFAACTSCSINISSLQSGSVAARATVDNAFRVSSVANFSGTWTNFSKLFGVADGPGTTLHACLLSGRSSSLHVSGRFGWLNLTSVDVRENLVAITSLVAPNGSVNVANGDWFRLNVSALSDVSEFTVSVLNVRNVNAWLACNCNVRLNAHNVSTFSVFLTGSCNITSSKSSLNLLNVEHSSQVTIEHCSQSQVNLTNVTRVSLTLHNATNSVFYVHNVSEMTVTLVLNNRSFSLYNVATTNFRLDDAPLSSVVELPSIFVTNSTASWSVRQNGYAYSVLSNITWAQAVVQCALNGAQLSTVSSEMEASVLSALAKAQGVGDSWLAGVNYAACDGPGILQNRVRWVYKKEPAVVGNVVVLVWPAQSSLCLAFDVSSQFIVSPSANFDQPSCTRKLPFVCKLTIVSATSASVCGAGWQGLKYGKSSPVHVNCYLLVPSASSWHDALTHCHSLDLRARLLDFDAWNTDELAFVSAYVNAVTSSSIGSVVWISAVSYNPVCEYVNAYTPWLDQTTFIPYGYSASIWNESKSRCLHFSATNARLSSATFTSGAQDCVRVLAGAICKRYVGSTFNGSFAVVSSNAPYSFPQAIMQCALLNGSVASFQNPAEYQQLVNYLQSKRVNTTWLGVLTWHHCEAPDNQSTAIKWIDDDDRLANVTVQNVSTLCLSFSNGSFQTPSASQSKLASCFRTLAFICKQFVKAGFSCKSGWLSRHVPLYGGTFCYLFVSDKKTWTEAVRHCSAESSSDPSMSWDLRGNVTAPRLLFFFSGDVESESAYLQKLAASLGYTEHEVWTSALNGAPVCEQNLLPNDYWADVSNFVYLDSNAPHWMTRTTFCPLLTRTGNSTYSWTTKVEPAWKGLASKFCSTPQVTSVVCKGLGGVEDITVRGLNVVKRCSKLYLDAYTSLLCSAKQQDLEEFYGKPIILADRFLVEQNADEILQHAKSSEVAFLVVGDPLGATTHVDLILRAKEKGIAYDVVHNASIMTAVGCCGLQLYSFGQCVTICMDEFETDSNSSSLDCETAPFRRVSYFERICSNRAQNLHTLCLLDLKVKELSAEDLARGRHSGRYLPARFLHANEAAKQLLAVRNAYKRQLESSVDETERNTLKQYVENFDESTVCVAVARCGGPTQRILACGAAEMSTAGEQLGDPLHTLIVVAPHVHPLEVDMLRTFKPPQSIVQF